ncbi:MAG: Flp pilus assembly protein CpaB [Devosia sp.]
MRVSRILLLVVALVAGGLAAWLATRGGGEAPPAEPVVVAEQHAQILVAKTNIGIGERLSEANIEWQSWPDSGLRPEYVTISATPDAVSQMKGAVARFEIFPGEPILDSKLAHSDQGYLSAVLDKGMRGVSISVTADSASGGFIVPNDHVDVIMTRNSALGPTAETLLSNVRVLAINTRLGEHGTTGAPDDPNDPKAQVFANTAIATLELDPGEAEIVANGVQLGKLSLSLRSIVDFPHESSDQTGLQRNAPIRIIRYGQEAQVTAAQPTGGFSVDTAALTQPPLTISATPAGGSPISLTPTAAPAPMSPEDTPR